MSTGRTGSLRLGHGGEWLCADLNLLGDSARLYFAVAREAEAEGGIY